LQRSSGADSCFEDFRDVLRHRGFEFPGLGVQGFKFLVQGLELFLEVLVARAGILLGIEAGVDADLVGTGPEAFLDGFRNRVLFRRGNPMHSAREKRFEISPARVFDELPATEA